MELLWELARTSKIFERYEGEYKKEHSFQNFIHYVEKNYKSETSDWEPLLWSGTDIYRKRLNWLDDNEAHILSLLNS